MEFKLGERVLFCGKPYTIVEIDFCDEIILEDEHETVCCLSSEIEKYYKKI